MGYTFKLNLNAEKVPNCVLGESRLGFDAWLLEETQTGEYNFPQLLFVEWKSYLVQSKGEEIPMSGIDDLRNPLVREPNSSAFDGSPRCSLDMRYWPERRAIIRRTVA